MYVRQYRVYCFHLPFRVAESGKRRKCIVPSPTFSRARQANADIASPEVAVPDPSDVASFLSGRYPFLFFIFCANTLLLRITYLRILCAGFYSFPTECNVGIGTTAPGSRLSTLIDGADGSTHPFQIGKGTQGNYVTILNNGNIGIGTRNSRNCLGLFS